MFKDWDFFHRKPLLPSELPEVRRSFSYAKHWRCPCGANLHIRSRDPRADGPSNFAGVKLGRLKQAHSVVPADQLNWDGLAHERGWETNPTRCPACQHGMTCAEYRRSRSL
jgi:hypothetical protein